MKPEPATLQEAILSFANPDNCLAYLVDRRWPCGVVCPVCGSKAVRFTSRRIWEYRRIHPKRQFSVKVGTILEDSPMGLDKWMKQTFSEASIKQVMGTDRRLSRKSANYRALAYRTAPPDVGKRAFCTRFGFVIARIIRNEPIFLG